MFATSEANLIAIFIDSMLKNSLYSYRNARQPEQDSYFSGLNGGFQLNSFLCWWFLCKTCPDLQGGFLKAQKEKLFQIPILSLSPSDKKTLENAAEKFAKSDIPITKTYKLEQEINTLVAHLYGLTLSEYTLILNDLKLSDEVRSACLEEFRGIAKNGAAGG